MNIIQIIIIDRSNYYLIIREVPFKNINHSLDILLIYFFTTLMSH